MRTFQRVSRADLPDHVDAMFERIVFCKELRDMEPGDPRHRFSSDVYDQLDLLDNDYGNSERRFLIDNDKKEECVRFDPEALWPFSVQMVTPTTLGDGWPDGTLQLQRVDSITTAKARAMGATMFSRRMTLERSMFVMPDGHMKSAFAVNAYLAGRWVNARHKIQSWNTDGRLAYTADGGVRYISLCHACEGASNQIAMAQSVALTQRYEWSVSIGLGNGPMLRLCSDPSGLRAMFRDRDRPIDKPRRAALRHWVREHYRQTRRDDADLAFVRMHLRGAMPFRWHGYDCVIRPSAYDLELEQHAIAARAAMADRGRVTPRPWDRLAKSV